MRFGSASAAAGLSMLLAAFPLAAEYPQLKSLTRDDPLYVQLVAGLEDYYRASQARIPSADPPLPRPPLSIFSYAPRASEDLFAVNARLNLTYDALATLNAADGVAAFNGLDRILVPSLPGLFVSDPPRSALEDMMLATRKAKDLAPERLVVERAGRRESMWFFPGESFNPVERAYFLRIIYSFPINRARITSRYGARANPFTGHPEFHDGIDIGAPSGTEVHAARDGTVAESGSSPVLGTYLILSHGEGWQTVYGHLSSTSVTLGQEVREGEVIGAVGSTGLATGPHLHFEVRRRGASVDPVQLLAAQKN